MPRWPTIQERTLDRLPWISDVTAGGLMGSKMAKAASGPL